MGQKIFRDTQQKQTQRYKEDIELFENNVKCVKKYIGSFLLEETWYKNDKLHREQKYDTIDLPARVKYSFQTNKPEEEEWFVDGKRHRDSKVGPSGEINDLPAWIKYNNGIKIEENYFKNNVHHRDGDLPCRIIYYENGNKKYENWGKNGKRHRDPKVEPSGKISNLPASIKYYENGNKEIEVWYQNDVWHRDNQLIDGAIIDFPAGIMYYENGKKAREDWVKNGIHQKIINYVYKCRTFTDSNKTFLKCKTEIWEPIE